MEAGLKKKRKFPEDHWYFNEPVVPEGCEFFTVAYRDLVTCRLPEGAIPWTAVALYADRKGLEPDVAELLWSVIRQMDVAEREWVLSNISGTEGGSPDA